MPVYDESGMKSVIINWVDNNQGHKFSSVWWPKIVEGVEIVKKNGRSWVPNLFENKDTFVIVGWSAGLTCRIHNRRYTKSSKLLCLTQTYGPRVGDSCCTQIIICFINISNFKELFIGYARRLCLLNLPHTKKRKELQLLWIVISWWMGMPVKSHFATRHISSVRLFVLPLIDYFQTLTSRSATQSTRQHSQYYWYNICVTSGIRAASKPATIRGTNLF